MADWWYYGSQDGKLVNPLWEYKQIIKNIKPLNDIIKEMTVNEAIQYIKDKHDTKEIVGNLVINYVNNITGYAPNTDKFIIGTVNRTPGGRFDGGGEAILEPPDVAWNDYAEDGGYVSIFGNAKETENVIPYLALLIKGTIPQLAIQAFVPQTVTISSILPYCGYSVDADFWKYSAIAAMEVGQELAEYTQNGVPIRGLVPAIIDQDKQVWVDNAMIEKLKAFVSKNWKSLIIEDPAISSVVNFFPAQISSSIFYYQGYITSGSRAFRYTEVSGFQRAVPYLFNSTSGMLLLVSNSPGTVSFKNGYSNTSKDDAYDKFINEPVIETLQFNSYTYSGKTVYWTVRQLGAANAPYQFEFFEGVIRDGFVNGVDFTQNREQIAWCILYSDVLTPYMPDGISARSEFTPTGETPSVLTNSSTYFLRKLAPVVLPPAQPYVTSPSSPDTPSTDEAIAPFLWPSVNQNEFVPYDPNEYPDMAYDPESATAPLPTPQNVPETQPIENPSSPGVPDISCDSSILDPPISGGISPIIGVPDPIQWPSAVPGDTSGTHNGDPGLIHVYNPSNTEMQSFGRWLWVTYNDVSLNKIFNNPFDGVIGAHELYATPASVGVKEKIRSGFLVSDVDAYPVLVRYTNINCGSIVIPEYWGNYLDYAPYTKVHVYLPFIGIVELEADDIIGHSVNINYAIDAYTGACIAQITVAKEDYVNTLYEFQGNCAVEVPITGGSQAAIKAGLITAAAYGITGLIGTVGNVVSGTLGGSALGTGGMIAGGILGGLEGLGKTAANAVNNVVSLKSSVQHSGTFGSSFGAMGIKKPYIIVKRPIQKVVPGYNQDYGYPAHKQVVIGQCQGYLKVLEINVVSPTATNDEKAQIEALLKQGVYVS